MNEIIMNKNYFSDSDRKKRSQNITQNKIKNLFLNLDENNFQTPLNNMKTLPKLKRYNKTNSNDSNFNETENIINILNNLPGENGKKIKVNSNKYNIQYNVSKKNLEKFFKNMKMKNKNNNNKNELKINNNIFTKRIRPFSSPGIKNKEIQNISSERRKLSFDKDKSIKLHYKNNSLFN